MLISALAPVDAMSGKFDEAYVAYRLPLVNGNRQFLRQFVTPFNTDTTVQALLRSYWTASAVAWLAVTPSEQEAWDALGAQMEQTDALGRSYTLNGRAAYQAVNQYRQINGQAITDTAPEYAATPAPSVVATASHNGSGVYTITFTTAAANDSRLLVQVSAPLPGLTRRARLNDMRIGTADLATSLISATGGSATFTGTITRVALGPTDAGYAIGVRAQALSEFYVPSNVLFVRRRDLAFDP